MQDSSMIFMQVIFADEIWLLCFIHLNNISLSISEAEPVPGSASLIDSES